MNDSSSSSEHRTREKACRSEVCSWTIASGPAAGYRWHRMSETASLSVDRSLCLRLTSPHETNETLAYCLRKTATKTRTGRWCVAAPLQPDAFKRMPDLNRTVRAVLSRFHPECIRVCVLSPDRRGAGRDAKKVRRLFNRLWRLGPVECHCLDARDRTANGTLLADFVDFS